MLYRVNGVADKLRGIPHRLIAQVVWKRFGKFLKLGVYFLRDTECIRTRCEKDSDDGSVLGVDIGMEGVIAGPQIYPCDIG